MLGSFAGVVRPAALALGAALAAAPPPAPAQDRLLEEAVSFAGVFGFLGSGAPGFVLGAVRDGETAFAGFGETVRGSGKAPDADTVMRIGSISKVFCGMTLASMVADDLLTLTDPIQDHLTGLSVPQKDGRVLRIIDAATQSSGLPREVPQADAPPDDPFAGNTIEAQAEGLAGDPFLFAPGTGALYSNWGFDLLGMALAGAGGKPYAELLRERVLDPLGMADTRFTPRPEDRDRMMQGHFFDGGPMVFAPTPETIECAGGLYTSANDMMTWMKWHLDRSTTADREVRLLDHAAWLYRDGLHPVLGLDDGGSDMDAMGLGWVIMLPEGNRPLILHKSGGLQGMFAYVAIAPTRGVGAFAAMNEFDVAGFTAMVEAVNNLVAELAPR
jgi:D-alanyl-D-alanine-carboxypeptidase/D-alanyl-D-alanine-endopeptidase